MDITPIDYSPKKQKQNLIFQEEIVIQEKNQIGIIPESISYSSKSEIEYEKKKYATPKTN